MIRHADEESFDVVLGRELSRDFENPRERIFLLYVDDAGTWIERRVCK